MSSADFVYHTMLRHILNEGNDRGDRTGTGTRGVFGYQTEYWLSEEFPLLTTKKMFTKGIIHELLWIIAGRTDVGYLQERGVKIWDEWATAEQCAKFGREAGDLGPVYGWAWRNFGGLHETNPEFGCQEDDGVDQLKWVVEEIQKNPNSRRLIVSAWDPAQQGNVALPPCHTLFQFYVREVDELRYLDCQLYQRSADVFLGVPFNIASYALLTAMVAHVTGMIPGRFVHTFGDLHIYNNHRDQVKEQMSRDYRLHPAPKLWLNPELAGKGFGGLVSFKFEDIEIRDYTSFPAIKADVSI